MYSDDQDTLERLIARLRELEAMSVHQDNQAILEIARAALLDAVGEMSLRIAEHRRTRDRGGEETPPPKRK
jgi:hypothetical protein